MTDVRQPKPSISILPTHRTDIYLYDRAVTSIDVTAFFAVIAVLLQDKLTFWDEPKD